jgi:hypothetical protein
MIHLGSWQPEAPRDSQHLRFPDVGGAMEARVAVARSSSTMAQPLRRSGQSSFDGHGAPHDRGVEDVPEQRPGKEPRHVDQRSHR